MSFPEIQPFNEPKPPMFPLIRDTSPNKVWDLEAVESFGSKLSQKLSPLTQFQKEEIKQQQKAALYSTLQITALQTGIEHLRLNVLSSIEFVHSRQNQEKVESKAYIDYRTLLREGRLTRATVAALQAEVAAKKKLKDKYKDAQEIVDELEKADAMDLEDTTGKGFTYVHNLSLYSGASSSNPFKKGTKDYTLFENNDYFDVLTGNFMSPLRALGQQNWALSQKIIQSIQAKTLKATGLLDPFQDSGTETFDIESNYNAMLTDGTLMGSLTDQETFGFFLKRWSDVKNYGKTLNTFTGRNLDHMDITAEIIGAEEAKTNLDARKNYLQSIQDIVGEIDKLSLEDVLSGKLDKTAQVNSLREKAIRMIKAFSTSVDDASKDDLALIKAQEREIESIMTSSGYPSTDDLGTSSELEKAKAWWEAIGSKVPTAGMLIPFGLMAETAGTVADEMSLGNWTGTSKSSIAEFITPEEDGLMDKAISGYLRHLKNNDFAGTKGTGVVSELMLAIDDITYGREVFNQLLNAGYITGEGMLTSKATQDLTPETLDIDTTFSEKERIVGVLTKSLGGNLNLGKLDKTLINDKERQQISLQLPNGEKASMEDIFDKIGKGTTPEEKYSNARDAYNVFFDMVSSMMNLGVDAAGSDGTLKSTKTKEGKIAVEIYPKGSWKEWSVDSEGVGQWINVEGKPVVMEFESQSAANSFFETMKKNLALLEPVVASFAPQNNEGPVSQKSLVYINGEPTDYWLRLLNDNEGGLTSSGVIRAGSAEHRYVVDTLQNPNYFKTEEWQSVSKFLSNEIAFSLGKEIFTKTMQNKMQQARHKQQQEDYKERKEEYEAGEEDRIKEDMKKENEKKAEKNRELKEAEKKKENEQKQLEEADRKRAELQREKENKERQAQQKKASEKG